MNTTKQIVLPHLEIDVHQLPPQTKRFVDALAAFVANPSDTTGLQVDNLREMARRLKMSYGHIEALLSDLDESNHK